MSIIKGKTWIAPAKGMACVAAVLFMSGLSQAALASCSFSGGVSSEVTKTVSFGKVTVQRDSPIGTVLATQSTGAYAGGAAFLAVLLRGSTAGKIQHGQRSVATVMAFTTLTLLVSAFVSPTAMVR
ncbi:hypothetical protein RGV33_32255 [Pseudomonas sp. Bout1]|nr:hypothetical protein [Pseudomonas sp. Bout1]MDY7536299.1 hypothetical protein [Pseudomonas sp. Bout1]